MTPACSIIIPTFNAAGLLDRCLDAIRAHPPRVAHELIVVDDGSTDDTFRVLAGHGDAVRVVHNPRNEGFAFACNEGADAARGRYLVFLNNDTRPRTGWLDALTRYAGDHPEATAIGAKLLYPDGTVQHAGVVFCQDGYPRHLYAGFPGDHPAVNEARRFQAVTAACLLIRGDVFERVGGFDEGYRNGFEDVDLCLRLGEEGGEIHYCPECVVEHLESVSEGRFERDRDNVRRYRDRWAQRVRRDDVEYYLADGLIRFAYRATYPHSVRIAPELATLESGPRAGDLEALLASRSRQVGALLRETARLIAHVAQVELKVPEKPGPRFEQGAGGNGVLGRLGPALEREPAPPSLSVDPRAESRRHEALESRLLALEETLAERAAERSGDGPVFEPGPGLRHREGVRRARGLVGASVRPGAALLVVSHGDPELVAIQGARAAHFPQTEEGAYAGHHPASSADAISQLESLRRRGEGDYLLIPDASRWWLDHYAEFRGHLERHYRTVADEAAGIIYRLEQG